MKEPTTFKWKWFLIFGFVSDGYKSLKELTKCVWDLTVERYGSAEENKKKMYSRDAV